MSRYIDADALIKKYGGWYTEEGPAEGFIGTIEMLVNEQPSIDIEPKRGEWIAKLNNPHNAIWLCSACNYATTSRHNFCPNCGAQMKGGRR